LGAVKCGIVSFTVEGKNPRAIFNSLQEKSINVSVSGQTSTRLDMESRNLTDLIRASVHYYNSEQEVERFCETLSSLISTDK
jgi:selenocysteine lyase/cysteine desulfurase